MADSSAIDAALVTKLGADAALVSLLTVTGINVNGVYVDESPPGATRFVIVSLVTEFDEARFMGRAFEDATFLVKAVMLSTSGGDVKAAAARIDALLEDGTLAPAGYTLMTMHRDERVRYTEVDDEDASIRWYHRGGRYRVQCSL